MRHCDSQGGDAASDHTMGTTKCIKKLRQVTTMCRPSVSRPKGVDDGDYMQVFGG